MSASPFDTTEVERRLVCFLDNQGLQSATVEAMRRFTVGFSWVTFGFDARWREGGRERTRRMILRLGPPNGIFAPYKASPEFVTLRALQGHGAPVRNANGPEAQSFKKSVARATIISLIH